MTLSLNRRSLAPIHCASTDKSRENLTTLHFEPDGTTVATDGHLMAVVTPGEPLHESQHLTPFELNTGDLGPILKEQRRKHALPTEVDRIRTNENGHCRIDVGGGAVEIPKVQHVTFPDWKVVQVTEPTHYSVSISLAVLEQMIATARQFTDTKKGQLAVMRFDFQEESELKPFTVTHEHRDGDTLKVTMMPCRK